MITTTGKASLRSVCRSTAALILGAGALALAGCVQMRTGPAPIYSRLPADQSGMEAHALTPAEQQRYAEIDRQTFAAQDQEMALAAQALAWSRYSVPFSLYGGYYGGWGRRGWGGWGIGVGGWGW